jgi:hypothetical protein
MFQTTIDPLAARGNPLRDTRTATIQACVDAMATPPKGGCATWVAVARLPVGAAIQSGLDAVAAMVEPVLGDHGATVETVLDALLVLIEAMLGALAVSGGDRGARRNEQQGSTQGQGQSRSHGVDLRVQDQSCGEENVPGRDGLTAGGSDSAAVMMPATTGSSTWTTARWH